jgi:anaerobic dimethyl sulfoxide reductase subunit A
LFPGEARHSCWLSIADAKARGVVDGDLVRVFSELAEMILPAYVTSRMSPGVIRVGFGAWYVPSNAHTDLMPYGIDRRGCFNFLSTAEHYPWIVGPVICTAKCEVEYFGGKGEMYSKGNLSWPNLGKTAPDGVLG